MLRLRSNHLSDAEMLLLHAAELAANKGAQAQAHLNACEECQAKAAELTLALSEVNGLCTNRAQVEGRQSIARTRLLSAMRHVKTVGPSERHTRDGRGLVRRLVFPCLAAAMLIVACQLIATRSNVAGQFLRPWRSEALPSKTLTPGATQAIALGALCSEQGSTARMPIDDALAKKVFDEYGLPYASRSSYEVDYLITPGLGGSRDMRNLWPEPEAAFAWNARVKDALEDHLHDLVCEGKMPLATAQSEISGDWIAAYKKHFHTDRPLRG